MPFIAGVFTRIWSWGARQALGFDMTSSDFDAHDNDMASGLSACILRDGTAAVTADIPLSGHTTTGIRAGTTAGEAVEYAQWQAGTTGAQNKLHNPSFKVNQRGVTSSVTLAANAYGHDRWKAGTGGCTYLFTGSGADTQLTITAGSLVQIVSGEDVEGGSYVLSQAGTAQGRVNGGSYAACPVTASSVAAGSNITVEFSTGTVLRPQLEPGATAHVFQRRPGGSESAICQRFYETGTWGGMNATSAYGQLVYGFGSFKATKLSNPTMTFIYLAYPGSIDSVTTGYLDKNGFEVTGVANRVNGAIPFYGTFTASCDL